MKIIIKILFILFLYSNCNAQFEYKNRNIPQSNIRGLGDSLAKKANLSTTVRDLSYNGSGIFTWKIGNSSFGAGIPLHIYATKTELNQRIHKDSLTLGGTIAAEGFKTLLSQTGFLKADGTVDNNSYANINSTNTFTQNQVFSSRVGIGTSTPDNNLEVIDASGVVFRHSKTPNTAGATRLMMGSYSGNKMVAMMNNAISNANLLSIGGGSSLGEPATVISFITGAHGTNAVGNEIVRITGTGLGIGSSTVSYPIHVHSSSFGNVGITRISMGTVLLGISPIMSNSVGDLLIDPQQASSGFAIRTRNASNSIINALGINRDGNVGIGLTSPTSRLHISGGDARIEGSSNGLLLQSPNGLYWRIQVNDSGILTVTQL